MRNVSRARTRCVREGGRGQEVLAMVYDVMIPGYATKNTNTLWL